MTADELLDLARRLAVPLTPEEAALMAPTLTRSRVVLEHMRRLPLEAVPLPGAPLPGPGSRD